MQVLRAEMDLGDRVLSIETGKLAMQAHGAVVARAGDTMCLATACMGEQPRETLDFFPLTVDYEERLYAAGKIPGSFFRREGRPSEQAILTGRMIDRGIRPLFPSGMRNEVQIIVTALSADRENQIDVLGMIGAAAALAISGIPFPTLLASMRVGLSADDEWVVYPTHAESDELVMDLVVSSTRDHVMMIEAGASEVDEDAIAEGVKIAQQQCWRVIDMIEDLRRQVAPAPRKTFVFGVGDDIGQSVSELGAQAKYRAALDVTDHQAQREALDAVRAELTAELAERFGEERAAEVALAAEAPLKKAARQMIVGENRRPDGRAQTEIRPLNAEVGVTPRSHGCGLFERGQTQVLCTTTLAGLGAAQKLDGLVDEEPKTFLHHYNMPPYSTGEAYRLSGPGRRAIGHGALAERALRPMMPSTDVFPYSIRLVSEAVSSNGSTSMASVCAGSLSMMDAGVPIKAAVGGMAMGIVFDSPDEYRILTDIQGFEDHNGDMDFKVAGTRKGVTALQMDVKTQGLTPEILHEALAQAREARMQVLDVMDACIAAPREELSPYAPRVLTLQIPVEKIGEVIGPGGKTIRKIQALGVTIDVMEDGRVLISGTDADAAQRAQKAITDIVREPEVGEIYEEATVTRLMSFGAFCEILPGKEGLLHISDYAWEHVPQISDVLSVGDKVRVKLKEIDDQGRINLTRKALLERPEGVSDSDSSRSRGSGRPGGGRPRPGGGGSRRTGGGGRRPSGDGAGGDVSFREKRK